MLGLLDWLTGGPKTPNIPIEESGKKLTWAERRALRKKHRDESRQKRREGRIEKIHAVKEKFYAVAAKRKWLFFIIASLIAGYLVITSGGLGGLGGILTKIKGFFN